MRKKKKKRCFITRLDGKYAFFVAKFILAILLPMVISRKPVQRRGLGEKGSFLLLAGHHPRVKESYQFVSNWRFPHKKVKFFNFNTKQVCNVKKKHFQCLLNVNGNFLI